MDSLPAAGTLTVVQRFGSGLNLNVHFHTVAFDGVDTGGPARRTSRASTCTPTCGWGPTTGRVGSSCAATSSARHWPTIGWLLGDGRARVRLKRAWRDGTTHLLFEPVEFLEKLAALTPRPAINLILYHGVLAPHARWRPAVVAYGRPGVMRRRLRTRPWGEPKPNAAAPLGPATGRGQR